MRYEKEQMNNINWLLALFVLFVSTQSLATEFYVRASASGSNNGADWNNAWKNNSEINFAMIHPGDTIYIADGTYNALNINTSGTSGNPITFKRATNSEHGTNTGWSNAYDGRVVIDGGGAEFGISVGIGGGVQADYITIDGATRYGIWVKNAYYGVHPWGGANRVANNLTLRYLEIGDSGTGKLGEDGIQGGGDNLLVEYCYDHDNDSTVTHGDGIQWFTGNNIILRYNVFKNVGQITMLGESAWNVYVNDVQIYYNIFYNRGGTHYNGITAHSGSPQAGHFFHVYNNTFDLEATSNDGYNNIFNLESPVGPVDFKNNAVIYSNAGSVTQASHSYNGYVNSGQYLDYNIPTETASVVAADLGFVNVSSADYHLVSSSSLKGKGINVGLTQDFDGNLVSATPSIGAFESGGSLAIPLFLAPPSNLRVVP